MYGTVAFSLFASKYYHGGMNVPLFGLSEAAQKRWSSIVRSPQSKAHQRVRLRMHHFIHV
jgi:hypothetical protein